jgi:NifB/MoaA-like Fe-S oxidoreductase
MPPSLSLRSRLLVNQRAGLLMDQLAWFDQRDLQIHAQVVVCPGLNDGAALERTLSDLARFASWRLASCFVRGCGACGVNPVSPRAGWVDPSR